MAELSIAERFDRTRLAAVADWLMVAVAVSLPWSTSATSILLVLWLLALIPTLAWPDLRRELVTPAGGLPVLLFLLGVLGMTWADVTLLERWEGLDSFFKLLVIPLLITQFRRSDNGMRVFIGFLIACAALLMASWANAIWPDLPRSSQNVGVPVKNYIVQSVEFLLCLAMLLYFAIERARDGRWTHAVILFFFSMAFLVDILFVATSRTTLVIIPVLAILYASRQFDWKGIVATAGVCFVLAGAAWAASPYLRDRVAAVFSQTEAYESEHAVTSTGERIVFWTKSIRFIKSAPLLGHGTGSITAMFRKAAIGETGVRAEVAANPHNQTFAVAIQLGLFGAAVLWAMWISQLAWFRGTGVVAWIGLIVVTQNIVGSLFNSFLFDFTEGWLYVVGVGVAGGMALKQRAAKRPNGDAL
jgi:O-antigen ligase